LWLYGILLRSKTIKPRLKNCPAHGVRELQRLVKKFDDLKNNKTRFFKPQLLAPVKKQKV